MITLAAVRELFDYSYWARDRQLSECSKLSAEQFLRPVGGSFSSLRDILAHVLGAEWIWLERFQGRSPRAAAPWLDSLRTPGAVAEAWAGVERDMRGYLAALNGEEFGRPLTYTNLAGVEHTYPLGQTLFHLANHGTYHRGQVTTLLRQLGGSAAPVDFLVYVDQQRR